MVSMKNTRNIDLMIDSLAKGGAERVCVSYANYLESIGYNVRLFLFRFEEISYQEDLNDNIEVIILDCRNSLSLFYKLIIKRIELSKIVLCFNHQIAISLFFYRRAKWANFIIIARNVNYLSKDVSYKKVGFKSIFTRFFMKWSYNRMDYYIAQCEEMKNDMISFLNIDNDKVKVIYNPVSNNIYHDRNVNKKYDVLFVGRLTPQKGIEYLYNILKQVIIVRCDLSICIIGKSYSTYGDENLEMILKLDGLNGAKIDYIESTKDMRYFYNASRVTILTSVYEGFPNVLNESINCCTPVVSFDCKSGPSEIINTNNGVLIKQYDCKAFSDAISSVLDNPIEIIENNKKNPLADLHLILGKYNVY